MEKERPSSRICIDTPNLLVKLNRTSATDSRYSRAKHNFTLIFSSYTYD